MRTLTIGFLCLLGWVSGLTGLPAEDAALHIAPIGDLPLENGDTLHQCQVGYRTVGRLNQDSSNVIIYPTWFAGRSDMIIGLLKPDKLFDPDGYYIIIFDALGNGVSSSPSNYPGRFPSITIGDMVQSQYRVITKTLGLKRIYGAIGGSMGSMQVFEWVRAYPDMIAKAVPYVCTPRPSSYDRINWHIRKTIIETGRRHGIPDRQIQYQLKLEDIQQSRSPDYYVEMVKPEAVDSILAFEPFRPDSLFTIDNYYTQLQAMIEHDIFRHDPSMLEGARRIKTRILMIVSMTDHLVNPEPAMALARLNHYPVLMLTNNRGHLGISPEFGLCRTTIQSFFSKEH
ncbi:MAG: alpha/beta hydrolase [Candidatus Delongbacteria bacterium]|nr:alpha/beta hydrolase [Candidatus Delongbacteria bacterium]